MIEFIQGTLAEKNPAYAVIEAGGVGYLLNISLNTFSALPDDGSVKLLAHYAVSVDVRSGESRHQLFGFSSETERHLFRQLINVSGVSSQIGRMILSGFKPQELQSAILNGDARSIQAVKGIGPKLAQRIVAELREKLSKDENLPDISFETGNTIRQEALSALVALGFDRGASQKVVAQLLKSEPKPETVEDLIKQALKKL